MDYPGISYTVDSPGAFRVAGVATPDMSSCSGYTVREEATEKIRYKNFLPFCSYFGCMPQGLFIITERIVLFYTRGTDVFSAVQFTGEPVGHSWNRAFCYYLPVLDKVFHLLFKC